MVKMELLNSGLNLMGEFCHANKLDAPGVHVRQRSDWRIASACAYYRPVAIAICPARCSAIGTAHRAWSYPGYVIDKTPYGVIQHELGHHVDHTLSERKGSYGGDFSIKLRQLSGEPKLTNYCPNDWEWFAEMFRLFVTNSDLLKALRPRLFEQLRERFKPVVDQPWREVLKDAPDRTIAMAQKKVEAV